jgi:hydrogenase nickel incorporation protein HypA/HybF
MHEMSIAMNVIELASAAARAESAGSITSIELQVGELAGVMVEALEFCFEAAAKGTPAEDARLEIVAVPGEANCSRCGKISPADSFGSPCRHCGAYLFDIIKGKDLRIHAITIRGSHVR